MHLDAHCDPVSVLSFPFYVPDYVFVSLPDTTWQMTFAYACSIHIATLDFMPACK